jgi:hypothetical protein
MALAPQHFCHKASRHFSSPPHSHSLLVVQALEREVAAATMTRSAKVLVTALLILAVAAEVQNIKMTDDSAAYLPTLRPTREWHDPGIQQPLDANGSILGFGSMLGGSSIPA